MKALLVDFDTPIYTNAGFCQTNYTYVHKETGERLPYTTQKVFHEDIKKHNKKVEIEGGSLMDINNYELVREALPIVSDRVDDPRVLGYYGLKMFIKKLEDLDWVEKVVLAFHGEGNFREDVATIQPYKGNRPEKPIFVKDMKEYLKKHHKDKVVIANGEETDDLVARQSWDAFYKCKDKKNYSDLNLVIGHVDKDLDQIPGLHYDYSKGELYTISVKEAAYSFWSQCLTGDYIDNIPGIPSISKEFKVKYKLNSSKGYGDKTAATLLEDCKTPKAMAERVVEAYKDGFGEEWLDKLQEISTLLYLRRQENEIFDVRKSLERLGVDYG